MQNKDRPTNMNCKIIGCNNIPRSRTADYCEVHYYRFRRNGNFNTTIDTKYYHNCFHCSKETIAGNKYCSIRCSTRGARGNPLIINCVVCGNGYIPINKGKDAKTCNDICKGIQQRLNARKYYKYQMENNVVFKERQRQQEYKRKTIKKNTQYEIIKRSLILERDKYICQICELPIKTEAIWPDPDFATLDHIIPLARGGAHTINNLQAAHLRCNIRKSDKVFVKHY